MPDEDSEQDRLVRDRLERLLPAARTAVPQPVTAGAAGPGGDGRRDGSTAVATRSVRRTPPPPVPPGVGVAAGVRYSAPPVAGEVRSSAAPVVGEVRSSAAPVAAFPDSDPFPTDATGQPATVGPPPGDRAGPFHPAGPAGPSASRLTGLGAFDPGRRGVKALAAVAVVVVLIAALLAWRARPRAEPVAAPVAAPVGVQESAAAPATGSPELMVTVAGKVRRAGLVRLPAGARLADALRAAGGVLPGVDAAMLNPARKVTDGELIVVGVTPPPGAPAGNAPASGGGPGALVNLNTATLAHLDGLPGVGPVLAQRILDHRDRHGGFRSVKDLRQVDGIGQARFEQLKDLVTV